ncbi:hypothetical protein Bbelb_093930 [Branchiostoma belcheri]|nr:hypothetical protein Bbelb_093930 [Branchiostoma belcheri]
MSTPPENKWTPRSALSNESGEICTICTPTAKEVGPCHRAPRNLLVSVTESTTLLSALRGLMGSLPPAQAFSNVGSILTPCFKKTAMEAAMWATGSAICAKALQMYLEDKKKQQKAPRLETPPPPPPLKKCTEPQTVHLVEAYWLGFTEGYIRAFEV